MNLPILYIRTCFILTLLEAVPRLINAGQSLMHGKAILWGILYCILYGMMLFLAYRMLRHHHIHSTQGLITLRLGLCVALVFHYGMTRPLPPIAILLARELLPFFQLFLACKAKTSILKLVNH